MLAHVYSEVFGKRTMLTFYLGCRLLKNLLTAGIPTSYGWMTCYFTSVFTRCQSYGDNEKLRAMEPH